ncbi:MAG TPA: peptidase inhibitor family I36 protein [Candidatus Limnocylindrales bacterium]|nr:peptidase inhibitor family I36 protein [Candidatus Limnocylindrales bacterium]
MTRQPGWVAATAITALVALVVSAPAPDALLAAGTASYEASVQAQIDAQLTAFPGGKQISEIEVAYDGGRFVITFARPTHSVAGTADCPSGWYCFYDGINFGYPRGKLSDCGWQNLATWGWDDRTESVHYNVSTGSVTFIDNDGGRGTAGDLGLFSLGPGNPIDNDVDPFRNMADSTERFC